MPQKAQEIFIYSIIHKITCVASANRQLIRKHVSLPALYTSWRHARLVRINCLLAEVTRVILWSNRYDRVDRYLLYWIPGCRYTVQWFNSRRAFWGTIPGGVVDFSLFHEPNLSDPNPQTADIKSGYRGRESRTRIQRTLRLRNSVRKLLINIPFYIPYDISYCQWDVTVTARKLAVSDGPDGYIYHYGLDFWLTEGIFFYFHYHVSDCLCIKYEVSRLSR